MFKWISYAIATSPNAETLGGPGFYVAVSHNKHAPSFIAPGNDVFDRLDDPDLRQLLHETDGEYWPKYCCLTWYGVEPDIVI